MSTRTCVMKCANCDAFVGQVKHFKVECLS